MEQDISRHPLDKLYSNPSLRLLEAIIPYVDYSMKLPLALLIKYQEVMAIINAFHNPSILTDCGLSREKSNPMDILSSLTAMEDSSTLSQIMSMISMFNMMQQTMEPSDIMSGMPDLSAFMNQMSNSPTMPSTSSDIIISENNLDETNEMSKSIQDTISDDDVINAIKTILAESEQEVSNHESKLDE